MWDHCTGAGKLPVGGKPQLLPHSKATAVLYETRRIDDKDHDGFLEFETPDFKVIT